MKKKMLALMLMAGGAAFADTHFSIGIGFGAPAYPVAPTPIVGVRPPCPGPGYSWVDGYRAAGGAWVNGYWAAPAYRGSQFVAPRVVGHDRDRDRDRRDDHARGRDNGRDFGRDFNGRR